MDEINGPSKSKVFKELLDFVSGSDREREDFLKLLVISAGAMIEVAGEVWPRTAKDAKVCRRHYWRVAGQLMRACRSDRDSWAQFKSRLQKRMDAIAKGQARGEFGLFAGGEQWPKGN